MTATVNTTDFNLKIKEAILRIEPDAEVILFGSRARGDHRPDSDWDLLVVTDQAESSDLKFNIRNQLAEFLFNEGVLLTALFLRKDVWAAGSSPSPVISEIRKEGVLL